jgi:hypothetical protein
MNRFSKSLVMTAVGSILALGTISAVSDPEILSILIQHGYIKVDGNRASLCASVLEILKDFGVVEDSKPQDILIAGPNSTGTGGGFQK